MKVNIAGVGLVPRVGLLAPVYGKDLPKDTVAVILNYSSFKVYAAATGMQITKTNIDEVFNPPVNVAATTTTATPKQHVAKKTDIKPGPPEPPVIQKPKFTPYMPSANIDETDNDAEYEPLPEITEDPETEERVAEPVTAEEKGEESKPVENNGGNNSYRNNGKKNKKRH